MTQSNKLVVISGCSGGGKSTLLDALRKQGYSVVPEVGRQIVTEQLKISGQALPWKNPKLFCEILIEKSVAAYREANEKNAEGLIFFDRSFLEGVSYFQTLVSEDNSKYDTLIQTLRFYPKIFMTPPWPEIYRQDAERQHSFEDAVIEYERLMNFYPTCGYQIIVLPKVSVQARVDYILNFL